MWKLQLLESGVASISNGMTYIDFDNQLLGACHW